MWQHISSLFDGTGFLPHGYCLRLRPDLLWLHVVSDAIIFTAYFMIPATLVYFILRRRYLMSFSWAIALFAAFIVLCGTGHLIEIVTIWKPIYYLQGFEKAMTALVSILTALAIIPLVPRLLAMRTPEEMEAVNKSLNEQIEARKRVEESLRHSVEDLHHAVRELEQFAYIASHDLQAPLRTMSGFSQLLTRRYRGRFDAEADEFLDHIAKGAQQMQHVISGLLTLSRVGRSGEKFERRPLLQSIDKAKAVLATDLQRSGAEIVCGDLPDIQGDHNLLAQLFQNLLGNACKFQRPGSKPRVEIRAQRENEHWHLVIRDNGIGIPADQLESVFVIFRRLHVPDEYEGAGIGLAICHKIVTYHGGEIWAAPCADGAEFHVRLPVEPRPSAMLQHKADFASKPKEDTLLTASA